MNFQLSNKSSSPVSRWNPYPTYKDSGVDWLGEVPAHWKVAPVYARYQVALGKMLDAKRVTRQFPGRYLRNVDVQWDKVNTEGLPEMDFAPWERDRYLVRSGDLLVCEGGEVGRTAMWRGEPEECFYQKAIHRVRPRLDQEVPRFLYYLMYSLAKRGVFVASGNPNTIDHLTAVQLRHYRFPFPPASEQRAIAAFLDRETTKIDVLVAKKERLIELLQEKRAALITRTVTKGLDPNVPMKDSGVEWLGKIPAHWETKKIKHLAKVVSKGTTPTTVGSEFLDQGIRFIKAENIENGRISDEPATFIDSATDELLRRSRLQSQDVLMVIAGATTGKVGIVDATQTPANTNQAVAFIRLKNPTVSKFLFYWLTGQKIWEQVWLKAVQAAQPNLSLVDISNFIVPVPTAVEIEPLEKYLDGEVTQLDTLIAKIREGIEKLKEYRTALISAAVTGKIDVRGEMAA